MAGNSTSNNSALSGSGNDEKQNWAASPSTLVNHFGTSGLSVAVATAITHPLGTDTKGKDKGKRKALAMFVSRGRTNRPKIPTNGPLQLSTSSQVTPQLNVGGQVIPQLNVGGCSAGFNIGGSTIAKLDGNPNVHFSQSEYAAFLFCGI